MVLDGKFQKPYEMATWLSSTKLKNISETNFC